MTAEAAALTALIERLGGQAITDVSPSGGRHLLVPFAEPRPWRDLYEVTQALGRRFPTLDTAPMAGPAAQICPPGSRHKSGGWRVLTMPLDSARAAAEDPCGPAVWDGLQTELAAELAAGTPRSRCTDDHRTTELPDELANPLGLPALRRLSTRLERIARSGRWRPAGYPTRSHARQAIVTSAAARGWSLADIRAKTDSGEWAGFAAMYDDPRERGRIDRLLPYEFEKAASGAAWGEKSAPLRHKRPSPPPGGSGDARDFAEEAIFGEIRRWLTVTEVAAGDPVRVAGWGQAAVSVRKILIALGLAAMVSGSPVIEFGCRNIALRAGVSYDTAARDLRMLREENDPLIELVRGHIFGNADRYRLRIPAMYEASAQWRRRRAGRVEAIHPVFIGGGGLGGAAGLVYQALTGTEERGAEIARVVHLSESAVSSALRALAEHGLAEHGPRGWRRGDADPAAIAEATGAADLYRARAARYADDRRVWKAWVAEYLAGPYPARTRAYDGYLSLDDPDEYEQMALMTMDEAGRAPPAVTVTT